MSPWNRLAPDTPARLGSNCWIIVSLLLCALSVLPTGARAESRNFRVEDLFSLEGIGDAFGGGPFSFSPDGRNFAIAIGRPRNSSPSREFELARLSNGRNDVWISRSNGPLVNITNGARDGSGWWDPQWSPDGRYLAMLSTRDRRLGIWLWDSRGGRLRRISVRNSQPRSGQVFVWLDENRLLAHVRDSRCPVTNLAAEALATAPRSWRSAIEGGAPTASVLRSGIPDATIDCDAGLLVVVRIDGLEHVVANGVINSDWYPDPSRRFVAWRRNTGLIRQAPGAQSESRFEVSAIDSASSVVPQMPVRRVLRECIAWTDDGRVFFVGQKFDGRYALFRTEARTGVTQSQELDDLELSACQGSGIQVLGPETVLLRASQTGRSQRAWWRISIDRPPARIVQDWPQLIYRIAAGSHFVGAARGRLWRLNGVTGEMTDLSPSAVGQISQIVWPDPQSFWDDSSPRVARALDRVVVRDVDQRVFSIALDRQDEVEIGMPSQAVNVAAFSQQSQRAISVRDDERGLEVWISDPGRTPRRIYAGNQFLREIRAGTWRRLDYQMSEGSSQIAWALLPPNFNPGQRYPTIVFVYPGRVQSATPPASAINSDRFLNPQIAAAQGYVVLFPSIPLGQEGRADDPLLKLTSGVIPGVDAAIAEGVSDPERLFLFGHSFGGFAVNALVTQTNRFRAAVSIAGLSDLASAYGAYSGATRYGPAPQEAFLGLPGLIEAGQLRMGAPPWRDVERYSRNSPIFRAEDIRTPLMLVHGDLDFVPIEQSEELFRALYRLRRRAEFVRYFGEGHIIESPANIRDLWRRTFSWFAQFGAGSSGVGH